MFCYISMNSSLSFVLVLLNVRTHKLMCSYLVYKSVFICYHFLKLFSKMLSKSSKFYLNLSAIFSAFSTFFQSTLSILSSMSVQCLNNSTWSSSISPIASSFSFKALFVSSLNTSNSSLISSNFYNAGA